MQNKKNEVIIHLINNQVDVGMTHPYQLNFFDSKNKENNYSKDYFHESMTIKCVSFIIVNIFIIVGEGGDQNHGY